MRPFRLTLAIVWQEIQARRSAIAVYILHSRLFWRLWRLSPPRLRLACYRWSQSHLAGYMSGRITMLPFDLVLKSAEDASPWPEADNMRFVAQNTSIPVPHVFDVVQSAETTCDGKPREGYLVMSRIHGISLRSWISKRAIVHPETALALDQLDACIASGDSDGFAALKAQFPSLPRSTLDLSDSVQLIEDLRRALTELRSIPPPHPDAVSGLHNRPLSSTRCTIAPHELGRFDSQLAFKNAILNHVALIFEDRVPALRCLAEPVLEKHHRICFTHADLHAMNILVRDGRLAGIIDWEHAGWYPEYWEYTMIEYHMPNQPLLQLFWDAVHPFGEEPYTEELALEWALWRSTGDKSVVGPRGDDLRCPRLVPCEPGPFGQANVLRGSEKARMTATPSA